MRDPRTHAVDTVMRVAHNLRTHEASRRALTAAECAVLAGDELLRRAGWEWAADGPIAPDAPPAASHRALRRLGQIGDELAGVAPALRGAPYA